MEYDFNTDLYGSPGTSILSTAQATSAANADSSLLDSFLKIVGTGATAYATVAAATKGTKTNVTDPNSPTKTAAPVIGVSSGSALTTRAKTIIGVGIGVVVLFFGWLLLRKKKR